MLHDEEESLGCFYDLVNLNDAGMSDNFENMDLSGNPLNVIYVLNFPFIQDFDSHFLPSIDVITLLDFSEGSLSKRLLYLVVSDHFGFVVYLRFGNNDFGIVKFARFLYVINMMHWYISLLLPLSRAYPRSGRCIKISSSIVLINEKLFTERPLLGLCHLDMHVGIKEGFKVRLVCQLLLLLRLSLLLHFYLVHLGRLIVITFLQ